MNIAEIQRAAILIVDDNPENLSVLFEYLSGPGFTVLVAQNGEDAIELIKENTPAIILLDILMPGIDGFETCKRLKENSETKDIPVIFMTALSDTVDKVRGFEAGAVDYITKPFQYEEVLARVRAHLTIQNLKKDLQMKNRELEESLERERRLMEDLRLNLSISLPHELRTPLNAILGFSEFLTDPLRLPEPNKIAEYGNEIYESGLRLHRLVENSLVYAQLKLLKYASGNGRTWQSDTSVDSKCLITSVVQRIAEDARRQEDMTLELADANILISMKNFEKILTELLDNAFKFSQAGTPVRIRTVVNGNLCILSITDQGRGMTKEQIANIGAYMQFDRMRHEQQGFGLGLIISYLLTQLEGGMLSVDSKPERGTMISVVLSVSSDDTIALKKDSTHWFDPDIPDISERSEKKKSGSPKITGYTPLNLPSGGETMGNLPSDRKADKDADGKGNQILKILVINGNQKNRSVLLNLLSPVGFEVIEASDCREGLNKVLEDRPALIFTDESMLEHDTFEVIHQNQQSSASKSVKIIAISDRVSDGTPKKNLMALCDDFISKPVQLQEIFEKLKLHLEVEWIYDEGKNTVFAVPPDMELRKIYDLAVQGQIKLIFGQLDAIEQSDEQYAPFVAKLRNFANAFQMRLIRQFVNKHLK